MERNIYYDTSCPFHFLYDGNLQASESAARQRARDRDGAFIHNRVRHPVSVLNDHFISFQRAVSRRVRAGGTGCIAPLYSFKRKLFKNLANICISNVFWKQSFSGGATDCIIESTRVNVK